MLVVGGGIAGVSAGHFLARHADVTLVDMESTLAYHTTGRSAALYFENYGALPIRPLSRASRRFFDAPPAGLVDHPLLRPRGALTIANADQVAALEAALAQGEAAGTRLEWIDTAGVREVCDAVLPEAAVAGLWEPDAADMDVAAIHQAFVRGLRQSGGAIRTDRPLTSAARTANGWTVVLGDESWEGDLVVDAAGAWGDAVAEACGVAPLGLQPKRRTAFMVAGRPGSEQWPLVVDVDQSFYFKPDGPQLLCSLADETPSPPCDARPEEMDVALAIDRINGVTDLGIRSVRSQWAGLRTFVADKTMAIGPDPAEPSFIWLVGQGGTGIQTAPAAGELTAALALGTPLPQTLQEAGVDPAALAPDRLRAS
ncbi:MAG TPA: FAD-binding oxidoreductase [Acidimicrobiia bacterium]|nr:FAD-binding oxidoreductase [Acidimicrobiia bacterium]